MLTTTPNELLAPIHDRMPVILDSAGRDLWLRRPPVVDPPELLVPFSASAMEAVAVSDYVNDPAHDTIRCLQPVLVPRQETLF